MANIASLCSRPPHAPRIFLDCLLTLSLSLTCIALFATSVSLYNTKISPNDGLAPLNHTLLITNSVPIVPLTISLLWSITQLSLLTRRVLHNYRKNSTGIATVGDTIAEEHDRKRRLVHPGWEVAIDLVCWVLMAVACGFVGTEIAKWKSGDMDDSIGNTKKINLKACPIIDPATGQLEYYCSHSWKRLVDLTMDGLNVMATNAYVKSS